MDANETLVLSKAASAKQSKQLKNYSLITLLDVLLNPKEVAESLMVPL